MNYEEYQIARAFLEKKSVHLMDHENKAHAPVAWPMANFETIDIKGRKLFIVKTNVFKAVIENVLPQACIQFPAKFGTNNGNDVIDAIYDVHPWGDRKEFSSLLQSEQFCYVFELVDGQIPDKVLRVDLFRMFKQNNSGKYEFIGGIFHALKHFSYGGCPLSTGMTKHDIANPDQLIIDITINFFLGNFVQKSETEFIVEMPYQEGRSILYIFYYEKNTGVYFLTTVYQKNII